MSRHGHRGPMRRPFIASICALTLFVGTTGSRAGAATVTGGDLVYAERAGWWGVAHPNGIHEIFLPANGLNPQDVHVTADGVVYLVGTLGLDAGGSLIRLREGAGPEVLSSGGSFASPAAVSVSPGGRIFVADQRAFGGVGAIFEIDPVTGVQREVMRGMAPRAVAALDDTTLAVGGPVGADTENTLVLIRAEDGFVKDSYAAIGFDPERLAIGPNGVLWASSLDRLYQVTRSPSISVTTTTIPYPYDHADGLGADLDGSPLLCGYDRRVMGKENGFILRYDRSSSQFVPIGVPTGGIDMRGPLGVGRMPDGTTPAATTTWGAIKHRYVR